MSVSLNKLKSDSNLKVIDALFHIYCRDGRIKVIGGDGIEGLFILPKQLPYKYLEVLYIFQNLITSWAHFSFSLNWKLMFWYHLAVSTKPRLLGEHFK